MIAQIEGIRHRHNDEAAIDTHLDQEEQKYQQGLKDGMEGRLSDTLFQSVSYMSGHQEGTQRRNLYGVTSEEEWQERIQNDWLDDEVLTLGRRSLFDNEF